MLYNFLVQTLQYLWPWKHKKTDLKSSILMAVWIFFLYSPDCPKQPRIEYPFYRFLYPMIWGTNLTCILVMEKNAYVETVLEEIA